MSSESETMWKERAEALAAWFAAVVSAYEEIQHCPECEVPHESNHHALTAALSREPQDVLDPLLKAAGLLAKLARHQGDCPYPAYGKPCNCGLDEARAVLDKYPFKDDSDDQPPAA